MAGRRSAFKDDFPSARNAAFYLLKIRQRSVFELTEKLKQKKYSASVIQETIAYLLDKKFLDDRDFAKNWISYRLNRPYGINRIMLELKQKGIAKDIIRSEIEAVNAENEDDVVFDMAQKRAKRYAGLEPDKKKRRIFDFLVRRGFNLDIIKKVLNKL